MISGICRFIILQYLTLPWQRILVEIAKLYFLKLTHLQMTILRINSLKFDKSWLLDVGMCTYDVLVLLAQPFGIELSIYLVLRKLTVIIVWANTFTF